MENSEASSYQGAPFPTKWRRNHPRSKTGCLTCRMKRKKCDEVKPICTACNKSRQDCRWPSPDKNQHPDTQLGSSSESIVEAGGSSKPINIIPGTSNIPIVPGTSQATSTSAPRAAPTYGNLAYLNDDSRRLYRQYLDVTAEMLTRGPSLDGNPFIQYLLPLASDDELVLDCILAIGGAHLIINDTSSCSKTARKLEVAARGHYAKVLSGIQKLLAYHTGQIIDNPDTYVGPSTPSRVLLILLLLCVYDHVQGSSRSSIYHHLKASREYITLLSSSTNSSDHLRHLRGFILELYTYHAIKLAISPRSLLSEEVLEIDASVHSLDVLDGYKSRGYLLGFGQRLFEMVPEISRLAEARREEEKRDNTLPTALEARYKSLLSRLQSFDPYEHSNGLRPPQESNNAAMIYQNALIVYLKSAFHRDMLADPKLAAELETRIAHVMPSFYALFVGDSPYRRTLLWPGVIMASCARRKEHVQGFRAGFVARASQTPGAVKMGARIIELLWDDTDPRAFGPRGLSYIMTKHGISFSLC
ncbi:transcriptional activator UGA3 [Fusarium beomiforme]|uniref:Transcriptional activator UGA3 n=1 Tax=Fusarium beomiforme TaxID=44412 RepID=A0A9P5AQL2_9HYPO|nr:transcriptional activator UGA3 [Fusarium beomiforme]